MSARPFFAVFALTLAGMSLPAHAQSMDRQQAFVEANILGIFYHELGHAVIDLMEARLGELANLTVFEAGKTLGDMIAEVREAGRSTQGVKLVTLKEGEALQDIARVIPDEDDGEEGEDGEATEASEGADEAAAPEAEAPEEGGEE